MAEQAVNELTTSTPALTDYIMGMSGTAEYKALVSAVAKKIVEDYAGSSLAGKNQSVKAALDELNSNSLNLAVSQNVIPSNANLNTYTNIGVYDCRSQSVASTLVNCPVTTGFRLIVTRAGYSSSPYSMQFIILGSGATIPRVYMRTLQDGQTLTWSAWVRLTTEPVT